MFEHPLHAAIHLARSQGGVLTRRQALEAGLTAGRLRELVRSGDWISPCQGVLMLSAADPLLGPVNAALLACPAGVVWGPTAARLHGFLGPRPGEPVHLLLPPRQARRQRRGMVLAWADPGLTVEIDRVPVTGVARTLVDVVLTSPDRESAVAAMDEFLRAGAVTIDTARALSTGRRGTRRVVTWWALADGRAESPLETRLRLLLADAGLSPPELQYLLLDDAGRPIARLDLAYPAHRLDVEADGERFHSAPAALYRDRHRQNDVVAAGWTVLRYTWADVTRRPRMVVDRVAEALAHGRD